MIEISPGLWHWTARRESIGTEVSSYYLESERVLIDPMIPPEGLDWLEQHGAPEHAILTNRHHDRDAWRLHDAFGCTVHCIRNGLYELEGRGPVAAFDFGDVLPGEIVGPRGRRDLSGRDRAVHPAPPRAGVRRRRRALGPRR